MDDNQHLRFLLADCAKGFYQQMYFLGRDVSHPDGNQLQAYGFSRTPSMGLKGTSCYTYESANSIIELYGSCAGVYADDLRVVFLRKRCRFYQWLPDHQVDSRKVVAGRYRCGKCGCHV